jgi:hypothetical protein
VNPQLSRRVGRIMMAEAVRSLEVDRHLAFVTEVSRAGSFDTLPDWVREVVLAGERQVAERAQRTSASDPPPAYQDEPRRRR